MPAIHSMDPPLSRRLPLELIVLVLCFVDPDTGVQLASVDRYYRAAVQSSEHYWRKACTRLMTTTTTATTTATAPSMALPLPLSSYNHYLYLKQLYWAWHHHRCTTYSLRPNLPSLWFSAYELVTCDERWAVVASGRPLRIFLVPLSTPLVAREGVPKWLGNGTPAAIELPLPPPPTQPRLVARHLLAPCWGTLTSDYLVVRTPRDRFFPSIPPCLLVWRLSDRRPLHWMPLGFADARHIWASHRWLLSTLGSHEGETDENGLGRRSTVERTFLLDLEAVARPSMSSGQTIDGQEDCTAKEKEAQRATTMQPAADAYAGTWRPVATFSGRHRVLFLPRSEQSANGTQVYTCRLAEHTMRWSMHTLDDDRSGGLCKVAEGTLDMPSCVTSIREAVAVDDGRAVILAGQCGGEGGQHRDVASSASIYIVVHDLRVHRLSRVLPGYRLVYPTSSAGTSASAWILLAQEATGTLVVATTKLDRFYPLNVRLPASYAIAALFPAVLLVSTLRHRYLFNMKTMQWQTMDGDEKRDKSAWTASILVGNSRCIYVKGSRLHIMDYRDIALP
ncbi:hypothetical protein SYNPS1DRAFT_28279 [Syncephalis pseudoplumigaleata]|uniref:F-box domain-containing protein n=1 Tax=Syncephalis pseudoplumigaleata TaxID=1712513 RepID=A0A4P9Z0R4_9FUNG|nr:hypothetical protein SYNPS1DRAFT_28279 [Syncephalis pseudoplumigaleata]|eukprot:RKP26006.1 hypothetical protein SYNPS1DRAFT_28279 [Syncephalis pseudoplumigaleata]